METLTPKFRGRLAAALAALFLGPPTAHALDRSKLPEGADHAAAQTGVAGLYTGRTGAGARVGVIEAPFTASRLYGIDPAQFHCGGRLIVEGAFQDTAPPSAPVLLPPFPMPFPGFSQHGTLVSDVVASNDPHATGHLGVASAANLYVGWMNNFSALRNAIRYFEEAPRAVRLFNNSYSFGDDNNGANQIALFMDWHCLTRDVVHVVAAGNEGPPQKTPPPALPPKTPNWRTGMPGDGYNVITVGAVDESFRARVNYSSYRLLPDGSLVTDVRGKPDLVAPGGSLGPRDGIDNDTDPARSIELAGTSLAAPHVAGASAMLLEAGLTLPGPANRNRVAHKAIILNAARKRFISPPRNGEAVLFDGENVCLNTGRPCTAPADCPASVCVSHTEASDYDYLNPDGTVRLGATGDGGTPRTREWTPTAWFVAGGLLSVSKPLDDELGTGMLDAERVLIQHAGGEQGPGVVGPIGWNRDAESPAMPGHVYTFSSPIRRGRFITATLTWDRAVNEINRCQDGSNKDKVCASDADCPSSTCGVAGVIDANDLYENAGGDASALTDFDLEIFKQPGDDLVARSNAIGGAAQGENVEHLHFPVDETGTYEIRVRNRGPAGLTNYAVAWWTSFLPRNHYQCYEVHAPRRVIREITLIDQFDSEPSLVDVIRAKRICNPAIKNGEDDGALLDPDHLTAYQIRQTTPHTRIRGVTVLNQFGEITVDLVRPDYLMVPSAKSDVAPPGPLASPAVDHFKCYRVSGAKFRRSGIVIGDQFGTLTVDVKKPRRLCVPVDKDGEGILDDGNHLMCYDVRRTSTPFTAPGPVFIDNQFGPDSFEAYRPTELCVPSYKHTVAVPTPVYIPTPTPTPTATP